MTGDAAIVAASAPAASGVDEAGRPTRLLPMSQLIRISLYWLGLTAIDSAVGLFVQNKVQFGGIVGPLEVGRTLFLVGIGGAVVSIIVQPTVGYLSDYTMTRWGRRKPYIVIGSLLDLLFLVGIATSNDLFALAMFVILLSFSTNIARGPFQGYVPDLVAAPQVGLASALVGLMQIVGNVTGFALAAGAAALGQAPLALLAIAVVELVTMASVVLRVGTGVPAKDREGRSWLSIARDTWATDILQERSYVWLVTSRLFFLVGGGILVNLVIAYMNQVHGLDEKAANETYLVMLGIVVVANVLVIVPSARLSDRLGRKPLIYASCAIGAIGILIVAFAPVIPVALVGAALFGASGGIFLAVDWALMTDIIPKASAGRYMGLSNVATGAATPISLALGGLIIDVVNAAAGIGVGPRVAYLVGFICYGLAAVTLRPVVEPDPSARVSSPHPGPGTP